MLIHLPRLYTIFSWISFNFSYKKSYVEISYYELHIYGNSANSYLKEWMFEVSIDEKNWHIVYSS